MITDGTPTLRILPIISPCGLNLLSVIWRSGFFLILNIIARVPAIHCPHTVAMAAPFTPICGHPRRPNIIIGSSIRLMTAPSIWVIILYIVRPVDCSNLSNVIWKAIPKAQQQHTSRYSVPYWITRASPV